MILLREMYKCIRPLINNNILYGTTLSPTHLKMLNSLGVDKPIQDSISYKLKRILEPQHIEVINESFMHNVPKGSETHFKVVVVSKDFENVPLIKRHRMINEILQDELKNGVHALSIVAKTPEQWQSSDQITSPSPACRGGFGK